MDNESKALNFIFVVSLLLIVFFSWAAIPEHDPAAHAPAHHEMADGHDAGHDTGHDEAAEPEAAHAAPAKPAPAPKPAQPAAPALVADGFKVIAMEEPAYAKHKKGIVLFTHERHFTEYGISCGDCHHDDSGEPLALEVGDEVERCVDCHVETEKPKGTKMPKDELIMTYHFEALHANCIGCHKAFNIKSGDPKGKSPAPVSCGKCHPKVKK